MTEFVKEQIIKRMESKNLSISALERRAGLSIHSVRNVLKGRIKKPSAQSLQVIAEALDCSLSDLLDPYSLANSQAAQDPLANILVDMPLMHNCCKEIFACFTKQDHQLTISECFKIISDVYFYSTKASIKTADVRFIQWTQQELSNK